MALRGKVAAIVDDDSLVINLGSVQGVTPGMRFLAISESGTIVDPDDPQKVLGELIFEIAKMEAKSVHPNLSYCSVERSYNSPITTLTPLFQTFGESKIDPSARRIGGPSILKLRIGTVVVEAPEEKRSSKLPPPPTSGSR